MKIIPIALIAILFYSCTNSSTVKNTETSFAPVDSSTIFLDSAKSLLTQSTFYIRKSLTNEMKTSKVNLIVIPLMAKYDSIFKKLNPRDTILINKFKSEKSDELLELEVQQFNKLIDTSAKHVN